MDDFETIKCELDQLETRITELETVIENEKSISSYILNQWSDDQLFQVIKDQECPHCFFDKIISLKRYNLISEILKLSDIPRSFIISIIYYGDLGKIPDIENIIKKSYQLTDMDKEYAKKRLKDLKKKS